MPKKKDKRDKGKEPEETVEPEARQSNLTRVAVNMICMMMNIPLINMFVDELAIDGGLRQRALRLAATSVESILKNGYDTSICKCPLFHSSAHQQRERER